VLRNTFLHLPNVGRKTEKALWSQGCEDWDCLLGGLDRYSIGTASKAEVRDELELSKKSLAAGVHQYFARVLGQAEAWRAYEEFKGSCVYLDIETDGGSSYDSITVIGMYDGSDFRCLVKGIDLEGFRDAISRYSMIVTYFGAGFDLPVLQKRFRGLVLDQIHLDLCPALRKVGYRGGLKAIEKQFNIKRSPETEGLSGFDAVKLWRSYYRMHNESALERLVAYNREDCVNLMPLAEAAFKRLRRDTLHIEPSLAI
jgi:uncharacterized protein